MKKIVFLFLISIISLSLNSSLYAQSWDNTPDEQLTKENATLRIQEFQARVTDLENNLKKLDADVEALKKELELVNTQLKECNEALYVLIGASAADVEKFKQQLGIIEGKIRDMQRLPDDVLADRQADVKALEEELNILRGNKITCLPDIYNKVIQLAKDIRGLYREKKIRSYTVGTWAENRDCLWNIAGKAEIYGDPFSWPIIWQTNTDQIKNPDLIFPGQVLQLPPPRMKNDDEKKAEQKYWRKKRATLLEQQQKEQQETPALKGN